MTAMYSDKLLRQPCQGYLVKLWKVTWSLRATMEGLSKDLFHKHGRPKDSNVSGSIPYNSRANVTWWYYDRWLGVVGQCRGHDGGPAKRCIPQTRPTKGQQCKRINSFDSPVNVKWWNDERSLGVVELLWSSMHSVMYDDVESST